MLNLIYKGNILLKLPKLRSDGNMIVKIADMGLSRTFQYGLNRATPEVSDTNC